MRQRREALGLTVRELACRVALRESSASYLSQLESGAKTPHADLARRLAAVLDDDPRIYLAWSATGHRADPVATAEAVRTLAETLRHPRYFVTSTGAATDPSDSPRQHAEAAAPAGRTIQHSRNVVIHEGIESDDPKAEPLPGQGPASPRAAPPVVTGAGSPGEARLLVPELADGEDPGPGAPPPDRVVAVHRVAAGALAGVEPPVRPFAFRVSPAAARRVGDGLRGGDLVVVSRRVWPLEAFTPCAVRLSGHLTFARAAWNGRSLVVLLPGGDTGGFVVLDTPDRTTLEQRVAGRAVAVVRAAAAPLPPAAPEERP